MNMNMYVYCTAREAIEFGRTKIKMSRAQKTIEGLSTPKPS